MHATRPSKSNSAREAEGAPLPLPRRRASLFFCLSAKKKKKKRSFIAAKRACCHEERGIKRDPGLSAPSALRWPAVDNAPIRCSALRNAIPFTGETQNYVKSRRWSVRVCVCVYAYSIIRGRWKSGTRFLSRIITQCGSNNLEVLISFYSNI